MIVAGAVRMTAIFKIVICRGMGTSGHTRTGESCRATFDGKCMRRIGFGQVTPGHLSIDVDRVLTLSTIRPIIEQGIPEHERLLPPGLSPNPAPLPVIGVVENCAEPLRPIEPRCVAESLGESPAPVAMCPSIPNSSAPYRFSKFILERSKLKSAGSLGSKKGPPKGFWFWPVVAGLGGGGCWLTEDEDKVGFWPAALDFKLKVGETGDCAVNGFWGFIVFSG